MDNGNNVKKVDTWANTKTRTIQDISDCNTKAYSEFAHVFSVELNGIKLHEAAEIHKCAMKVFRATDNLGKLLGRLAGNDW
jgi:hypothetical protein